MARVMVMGGISIGLSALLAALLLTAAPAPLPSEQQPAAQAPAQKPPVDHAGPTSVVLPPPPTVTVVPIQPIEPLMASKPTAAPVEALQPTPPKAPASLPKIIEPVLSVKVEKSKPAPVPKAKAAPDSEPEAKEVAAQGRVLLQLLEHGQGPVIELAWPRDGAARSRLYRRFRDCFGMQVALNRGAGELFVAQGPAGTSWRPNRDRYSGFARQPAGRLAAAERRDLRAIARHHDLPNWAAAMRIFPRYVDARLLGGLEQLLAAGYAKAGSIRARYHLRGGGIVVREIQVDGRAIPGSVDLGGICGRT